MSDTITLTREELHKLVWSTPTEQLAKKFGFSGSALVKICRKLCVPKPNRGHWARIEVGQTIPVAPLPPKPSGVREEVAITPTVKPPVKETDLSGYSPKALAALQSLAKGNYKISVQSKLTNPHPIVLKMKTLLETRPNKGALGLLHCLAISATQSSVNRALIILDTVLKIADHFGYSADASKLVRGDYWRQREILFGDFEIPLYIRESIKRSERALSPEERSRGYIYDRWIWNPSGRLNIHVAGMNFHDGKKRRVELQIADVVSTIIHCFESCRLWEAGRADREREEAVHKQMRERLEHEAWVREEDEMERQKALEDTADQWAKSERLRAFISACEVALSRPNGKLQAGSKEARWIAWAREHADRLDPLRSDFLQEAVASLSGSVPPSSPTKSDQVITQSVASSPDQSKKFFRFSKKFRRDP